MNPNEQPLLALPVYVWFRPLDDGWLLLWSRRYAPDGSAPITIQLLKLDHLRPLIDLDRWMKQEPPPTLPHFSIDQDYSAAAEVSASYPPGRHELTLPEKFALVPEFFVVTNNPALPQRPGTASYCIYVIDPKRQMIEVLPQDWFNEGGPDYEYQGITKVTRDPTTRRLLVSGIRIDVVVLDETGRQVAYRLPPHLAR